MRIETLVTVFVNTTFVAMATGAGALAIAVLFP
jgi:hypothetical protein